MSQRAAAAIETTPSAPSDGGESRREDEQFSVVWPLSSILSPTLSSIRLRCAPAWLGEPRRSRRRRRADGGEGEIKELDAALDIHHSFGLGDLVPPFTVLANCRIVLVVVNKL